MIQLESRVAKVEDDMHDVRVDLQTMQLGVTRIEAKIDSMGEVQSSILRRLTDLETDVGTAKRWLSKVWPLLTALFAGAAGKDAIMQLVAAVLGH